MNIIEDTDFYNTVHHWMKKPLNWEGSHIYMRNRPGILFGMNELVHAITAPVKAKDLLDAEAKAKSMGCKDFPSDMWRKVIYEFGGFLPLKIEALPEGTWCPKGTPIVQIRNTVAGMGELITWIEARLLGNFFQSGCATEAYTIAKYLKEHNFPMNRVHSFARRSYPTEELAIQGGKAWNLFLTGSDDLHVADGRIASIPASAHKVVQTFNEEFESYVYALSQAYVRGYKAVSIPIDTFNPYRFVSDYAEKLAVMAEQMGITLVFRPDSGDVVHQTVLLYNKTAKHGISWKQNVIIGEGMTYDKMVEYDQILSDKVPLGNIFYGIGGGFHKHINRDYLGYAMKTCYADGDRMKFSADPVKQSLPGFIGIVNFGKTLEVRAVEHMGSENNMLRTIYEFDPNKSSNPQRLCDNIETLYNVDFKSPLLKQESVLIDYRLAEKIQKMREKYLNKPVVKS